MLKDSYAFSGFSIKDALQTKKFYIEVLGLTVESSDMGLHLVTQGNNKIFMYEKADHEPANYTILNFPVENIDETVDELRKNGVDFEEYDFGNGAKTDEKGIMRGLSENMGPDIAWIKDPSGNILAVLQDK